MLVVQRREVRLDDRPVAARDRAGQLEAVLDRARHQRDEPFGRRARVLEQPRGRAVEGDDVVRGDGRARVVERARRVGEVERLQPERLGEPPAERACLLVLRRHRRPGAVELLRPARQRERLQRVNGEAALVRIERCQRGRAADVRDPRPRLDRFRYLRDRPVGHAKEHELGVVARSSRPRSRRRAATADPTRPRPITLTLFISACSSPHGGTGHADSSARRRFFVPAPP